MEPVEYLRALRRFWFVIAGAILVALVAAWFTKGIDAGGGGSRTFLATTVLFSSSSGSGFNQSGSLDEPNAVAFLTTREPIPGRVADELGYEGKPSDLASKIDATVDQDSGLLNISATDTSSERAKQLSDTFAAQLLERLIELRKAARVQEAKDLRAKIKGIKEQIEVGGGGDTRDLDAQLAQAQGQLNDLTSASPDPGFQIAAPADVQPVTSAGFAAPRSLMARALIAAVIGLLAGIVIALVLARFDTKIRTKPGAEKAFSLPVLAEIPVIRGKRSRVLVATYPSSRQAEAFRVLGAEVSTRAPANGEGRTRGKAAAEPPQTLLVTSPGPSDGKTTVVANLAATLAETGKKVLIISCDFHRPSVHRFFGISNDRGLTNALQSEEGGPTLDGFVQETAIEDIEIVPSGPRPRSAGELLASDKMRQALGEARKRGDVVLIDTPPILVASDASHLLSEVDAVLVVARAGRTKSDLAERTTEMLVRLGARVSGVVLNRAAEISIPRGYRLYYRATAPAASDGKDVGDFPSYPVTQDSSNV